MNIKHIRWGVRAVLVLGVVVSVIANILHAAENPISRSIAAWPPLALLLTVELISRVPVHTRWLAVARIVATAAIAGIAAWVSYWHMAGVALRYGESSSAAHLIPFSVDGLIVVASICLVEIGGRIRAQEADDVSDTGPADLHATQPIEPGIDWDELFAPLDTPTPVSPAPAPVSLPETRTRKAVDARRVVEMILDGATDAQIISATQASRTSVGRLRKVTKALQSSPRAAIDPRAEKVTADNVAMIRELVTR